MHRVIFSTVILCRPNMKTNSWKTFLTEVHGHKSTKLNVGVLRNKKSNDCNVIIVDKAICTGNVAMIITGFMHCTLKWLYSSV